MADDNIIRHIVPNLKALQDLTVLLRDILKQRAAAVPCALPPTAQSQLLYDELITTATFLLNTADVLATLVQNSHLDAPKTNPTNEKPE